VAFLRISTVSLLLPSGSTYHGIGGSREGQGAHARRILKARFVKKMRNLFVTADQVRYLIGCEYSPWLNWGAVGRHRDERVNIYRWYPARGARALTSAHHIGVGKRAQPVVDQRGRHSPTSLHGERTPSGRAAPGLSGASEPPVVDWCNLGATVPYWKDPMTR
jgi:hypothetical protein